MDISAKLKELRTKRGLSQERVAEQLYVSRQAISKWENGEALPDMENLVAISKFYGVSIDYILGADEESGRDKKPESEPESSAPSYRGSTAKTDAAPARSAENYRKMRRWKGWYTAARVSLIVMTAITVINFILKLCNVFDFSLPFGASFPSTIIYYAMTFSGRNHALNEMLEQTGATTIQIPELVYYEILLFTITIILIYIASCIFSNNHRGSYLVTALVLWIGDGIFALLATFVPRIMFKMMGVAPQPLSFMFYLGRGVWLAVLVILIVGISAGVKIYHAKKTQF
jgi:transcriptional regulator with XRE-family HTH domain